MQHGHLAEKKGKGWERVVGDTGMALFNRPYPWLRALGCV